jgi:hypothetical protein
MLGLREFSKAIYASTITFAYLLSYKTEPLYVLQTLLRGPASFLCD